MTAIDYHLSKKWWCLHWSNWKSFIDNDKSVFNDKINKVCVLFVCCNSFHLFDRCYEYLIKESNQNFDILVVDNSTDDKNIDLFHEIWVKNKNISILKPIGNIWWSWWFSIWMEYVISKNYDYLIIFEDDIIPVDKDIITSMISKMNENVIVQNNYINTYNSIFIQWWVFHLTWYPIKFLRRIWVSSPIFFLKWDDAELETRINHEIKLWKVKIVNTWKMFFHPHQKKDGRKNRVLAFSIRNYLQILQDSFSIRWLIRNLKEQFLYIRYWLSKLFIEWCLWVLRIYFSSVRDFLAWHIWYEWNLKLMNKYKNIEITKSKTKTIEVSQKDINKYTSNKYYMYAKIMWHDNLFWEIKYSKSLKNWFKHWIIAWWVYNPIYPVFMCFRNIIFLEEYDYGNNVIKAELFKNNNYILSVVFIILSFFLSIPIYIVMMLIILIKILWNRAYKLFIS